MAKKTEKVHLALNIPAGFNIDITVDGKTHHVQTEHGSEKNPLLTTHIYEKGAIVYSRRTDYSEILKEKDYEDKLRIMKENQHKSVIEEFTKKIEDNKKKTGYFEAIKKLLSRRNNKQALRILEDALQEFPEDPFIMSYFGCLTAIVEKKHEEGIKICQRALKKLDPEVQPAEKSFYAGFYHNLGRAYIAGGQRQSAIDAFNNGLKIDRSNHDLLWELKKLGTRKKPPIPFLSRNNLINKYIGMILAKFKGK